MEAEERRGRTHLPEEVSASDVEDGSNDENRHLEQIRTSRVVDPPQGEPAHRLNAEEGAEPLENREDGTRSAEDLLPVRRRGLCEVEEGGKEG